MKILGMKTRDKAKTHVTRSVAQKKPEFMNATTAQEAAKLLLKEANTLKLTGNVVLDAKGDIVSLKYRGDDRYISADLSDKSKLVLEELVGKPTGSISVWDYKPTEDFSSPTMYSLQFNNTEPFTGQKGDWKIEQVDTFRETTQKGLRLDKSNDAEVPLKYESKETWSFPLCDIDDNGDYRELYKNRGEIKPKFPSAQTSEYTQYFDTDGKNGVDKCIKKGCKDLLNMPQHFYEYIDFDYNGKTPDFDIVKIYENCKLVKSTTPNDPEL